MKEYPSIQRKYIKDEYVYVFDKLDGSNIRVEWSAKRGFYKFGTKTQLIDEHTPIFGEAIKLFLDRYDCRGMRKCLEKNKWQRAVFFAEFLGPNSFAGNHKMDEQHEVVLFDVSVNDAILDPREFCDNFDYAVTPKLLLAGERVDEDFIKSVHDSKLDGMTFEGVVCKGFTRDRHESPMIFKIKSNAWIEKLKEYCNGNMDLMARLL